MPVPRARHRDVLVTHDMGVIAGRAPRRGICRPHCQIGPSSTSPSRTTLHDRLMDSIPRTRPPRRLRQIDTMPRLSDPAGACSTYCPEAFDAAGMSALPVASPGHRRRVLVVHRVPVREPAPSFADTDNGFCLSFRGAARWGGTHGEHRLSVDAPVATILSRVCCLFWVRAAHRPE